MACAPPRMQRSSSILDYTLKQHARCRLLLLFRCLQTEGSAGLDTAGMKPHLSDAGNELLIKVDSAPVLKSNLYGAFP